MPLLCALRTKTSCDLLVYLTGVFPGFGTAEAWADGTSTPLAIYAQRDVAKPFFQRWQGPTSNSWWTSASMLSTGVAAPTNWTKGVNSPTADESACLIFDNGRNVSIQIYDGATMAWGASTVLCSASAGFSSDDRGADIAYENGGDLLVTYWKYSDVKLAWRTRTPGGNMSNEFSMDLPDGATGLHWVSLTPRPNSNKILMTALDDSAALFTAVWSGGGWGTVETLATGLEAYGQECFAAAYEQNSKEAMVVYGKPNQATPYFRVLSGSGWSAEQALPSIGAAPIWIRLAPRPTTNEIVMVAMNSNRLISACTWNGSSWGSVTNFGTGQANDRRGFDVAWNSTGTKALALYGVDGLGGSFKYRTYDGASWSGQLTAGQVAATMSVAQVYPGPISGEIWAITMETANRVHFWRYTGAAMTGSPMQLHTGGHGQKYDSFGLVLPRASQPPEDEPFRVTNWREIGAE